MTDNGQQWKRNKTYTDVVVNITKHLDFCFKTKNDYGMSPNRNKKDLRNTVKNEERRAEKYF